MQTLPWIAPSEDRPVLFPSLFHLRHQFSLQSRVIEIGTIRIQNIEGRDPAQAAESLLVRNDAETLSLVRNPHFASGHGLIDQAEDFATELGSGLPCSQCITVYIVMRTVC